MTCPSCAKALLVLRPHSASCPVSCRCGFRSTVGGLRGETRMTYILRTVGPVGPEPVRARR